MFDEYGNGFYGESCGMNMDYGMDYGMGFGGDMGFNDAPMYGGGYGSYKPIKATTRNVQDVIAFQLGCDPFSLEFIKLDEMPPVQNWRHSCYQSGVTNMQVTQFVFDDGSNVIYGICPFFPECNKVHYYVERNF